MTDRALTEWDVRLDPSEVASNRTELLLNSGPMRVDQAGIDWGDAAIQAFMADQLYGSSPVDYRVPNRIVTIPLAVGADDSGNFDTVREQLHQKVALLQQEGGWLKRARTGVKMYADVVDATLHEPDVTGATGGIEVGLLLTLECLPDFYGDEITLDTISGTGYGLSVLKFAAAQAAIQGDYPARCRLVVTDGSGNAQSGLIWGLRSRHYDAASTAALFYEAESMTGLNGAASAVHAGASGGHTMKLTSVPYQSGGLWVPMLLTDVSAAQLTHQGTYRVWARVYATDVGTSFRLLWGSGSLASPITNDEADVPGTGAFYLVDLGMVRLDATPVSAGSWQGVVQVQDPNGSGTAEIDCLYLQPLDESSGRESALVIPSPTIISASNPAGTYSDNASSGTQTWSLVRGQWYAPAGSGVVTSHYLKFANLGLAIPLSATITGIVVNVQRYAAGQVIVFDTTAQMLKAGALVGTNRPAGTWGSTPTTVQGYGAANYLWGTTWTPAQVNASGFGFELQVGIGDSNLQFGDGAYVKSITITVYYQLSAGFTVAQDVVIDASSSCEIRTEGAYRPDPGSGAWGDISVVLGDLPRIPPSRLEARAVELFVKPSRGDLGDDPTSSRDGGLDAFTVVAKYRPSFLLRP